MMRRDGITDREGKAFLSVEGEGAEEGKGAGMDIHIDASIAKRVTGDANARTGSATLSLDAIEIVVADLDPDDFSVLQ